MQQPYTVESGTTAGGAGVSAATSTDVQRKNIKGRVLAVGLDFIGSHPATTDVIVRTKGLHGPVQTLLTLANVNTDGWYYPVVQTVENDGSSPAFYAPYAIDDEVEVVIAQSDDGLSVTAYVLVEP